MPGLGYLHITTTEGTQNGQRVDAKHPADQQRDDDAAQTNAPASAYPCPSIASGVIFMAPIFHIV